VPVVFTSVFEHNSNLLPWKESGVQIEMIPMTDDGDLDYLYLEEKLKSYKD
jgi:selenocysteine lyase/cysteine desulfurase